MPGPVYQKKSSKSKTAAPNAAIVSPANGNMNTVSKSTLAIDFHCFLEIADHKSIAQFCNLAAATSDGENLRLLWICVLEEGEKLGVKEGKKLGLKEGIERGMDLGCEEGYLVAKEGFDRIIEGVKSKGTSEAFNTHETAMQTDGDKQQQSTAMQMMPTLTANTITQTEPTDKLL